MLALTPSGTTNTFTLGGSVFAVDSGVAVSPYDANLSGATVTIGTGYQSADAPHFTNQNGISGTYSGGVLTLSGIATPAQYQTALQSVTFSTTSTNTTTREISIVAFAGALTSNSAAEQVDVSTTLPTLTPSGTTNTATVRGPAVAVDSGLTGKSQQLRPDRCHRDDLGRHPSRATRSISSTRAASAAATPLACCP